MVLLFEIVRAITQHYNSLVKRIYLKTTVAFSQSYKDVRNIVSHSLNSKEITTSIFVLLACVLWSSSPEGLTFCLEARPTLWLRGSSL